MAEKTLIAWTDHTFNPWMGCHKVSPGCKNCYAEALVKNRMGRDEVWGAHGIRQRTKAPWKNVPKWNRAARELQAPARVFCASLADVFEDYDGPNRWRNDVWNVIRAAPWLDFQILTKRPENIARMLPDDWDTLYGPEGFDHWPNVWLGTSIEDQRVSSRATTLVKVPAIVHFISYEPALGPLDGLPWGGIEWVICGGESGPGHRKLDLDWARSMRARCAESGTAFFFKQDSGYRTEMGIDALGEIVREYPVAWDRGADRNPKAARRVLPASQLALP